MLEHLQNFAEIYKTLISEFITLIKLILVLPAKDATSERSFGILRLIKVDIRSTTG